MNMNQNVLISLFVSASLWVSAVQSAEDVVVIVNADNTQSVSKQQIKNIYADITAAWSDGEQITVFHLPVDDDAREVFSQAIFGESAEKQAAAELNRKITNTIKNPSKTKSANLVKKMVKRDPKAIGYIPKSSLGASKGLRVVLTLQSP